jgi:hypothetical protein
MFSSRQSGFAQFNGGAFLSVSPSSAVMVNLTRRIVLGGKFGKKMPKVVEHFCANDCGRLGIPGRKAKSNSAQSKVNRLHPSVEACS